MLGVVEDGSFCELYVFLSLQAVLMLKFEAVVRYGERSQSWSFSRFCRAELNIDRCTN